MIGCVVARKCFVACLFLDESQHPTWPQLRQSRRWTQSSPISRHSLQPEPLGLTLRICETCSQTCVIVSPCKLSHFRRESKRTKLSREDDPAKAWTVLAREGK